MSKRVIKITESDLRSIVSNSVRRIIKESLEQTNNGDNRSWDALVQRIIPQVREIIENEDYSDRMECDGYGKDLRCTLNVEEQIYEDKLDLSGFEGIIDGLNVNYTVEGWARQTYYLSADYYHPEESEGEGTAEATIDSIDLYLTDGSEETLNLNIPVCKIDLGW